MRRDLLLLGEMIDAATEAVSLTKDADIETLEGDRRSGDVLLWNFTVLGEAAAQLDDAIKARFAEVPWSQPSRLRNRIVHGYWTVDFEILHNTASKLLPGFIEQLKAVLDVLEVEENGTKE